MLSQMHFTGKVRLIIQGKIPDLAQEISKKYLFLSVKKMQFLSGFSRTAGICAMQKITERILASLLRESATHKLPAAAKYPAEGKAPESWR